MTFQQFENIVKGRRPDIKSVHKHTENAYTNSKTLNVGVCYSNGKAYSYHGTYCEVLNKLGIKAIYQHDVDGIVSHINDLKESIENPEPNPFLPNVSIEDIRASYIKELSEYETILSEVLNDCIIV